MLECAYLHTSRLPGEHFSQLFRRHNFVRYIQTASSSPSVRELPPQGHEHIESSKHSSQMLQLTDFLWNVERLQKDWLQWVLWLRTTLVGLLQVSL
jgi:hypothetical protein